MAEISKGKGRRRSRNNATGKYKRQAERTLARKRRSYRKANNARQERLDAARKAGDTPLAAVIAEAMANAKARQKHVA